MERWCHTTVNPSLLLLLLISMTTTMAHDASDPSLNLTMGFQALNFLLASDEGSSTHNNNERPPPYARNNDVTSTTLIRKGTEASDAMFPYMVSLQVLWTDNRLYHICGGVLFTPNKLLTAAHCMIYWGVYEHFAALGVQHISLGGEALIRVENATIHPDFDSSVSEFPWDIAVLALETDAVITSKVQLATLATFQDPTFEDLDECEIMGWGSTMMGDVPDSLHFAIMKGISNNDCRRFLRIFRYRGLQQYHKCAWNWPHGSCQGDSGGPLVCQGLVVGISSWGVTGCTGCFPSVYSKVAYHNGWIHLQ